MDKLDQIVYILALAESPSTWQKCNTAWFKNMINDFHKLEQNETAISRSLNKLKKQEYLEREDTGNRLTDYWIVNTYNAVDTYVEYLRYKHPPFVTEIFDKFTEEEIVQFYMILKEGANWLLRSQRTAGFPLIMEWITWFTDKYLLMYHMDYDKHKNIKKWITYLKNLETAFNDEI